ncbi:MAG: HAD family hydrolase [Erysipelotrichaceae bacterium]|nr:HAD family hydrolase [Erysipelotrichaceae bacterium]
MIKLIVCDCDGTLLNSKKKVDEGIGQLMPELEKRGIILTIATGRNEELVDHYIDEIGIKAPYITDNGATIHRLHQLEKIYEIPREYNKTIIDILLELDVPFVYFAKERSLLYRNSDFFAKRLKPFFDRKLIDVFGKDTDVTNDHVFKITMDFKSLSPSVRSETVDKVKKLCPQVNFGPGEGDVYSLNFIKAGKGNALREIMAMLGIRKEEVIAFGDNFNDLPLLKEAGKAIVMANAEEDLKALGYEICGDNDHLGVSTYLKEMLGIKP